jgi:hypothetical protein
MRTQEYCGDGFSVRIEPNLRELVFVIYTRAGEALKLSGERIGEKWEAISVLIPENVADIQVAEIVHDLRSAFVALHTGFVIRRKVGVDTVPEPERQAALTELRTMGFDAVIQPNGAIRLTKRPGETLSGIEPARAQAPRIMSLIQSVHGMRARIETLAKSKDAPSTDY